jgi:hypothetical protein
MSGEDSYKIELGRGGLIGNSKMVALCFGNQVVILDNPIIERSSYKVEVDYYKHQSGFPSMTDFSIPLNQKIILDITLTGSEGRFIVGTEEGFTQRLLTEDITILQMIRLVREKLEKRKI